MGQELQYSLTSALDRLGVGQNPNPLDKEVPRSPSQILGLGAIGLAAIRAGKKIQSLLRGVQEEDRQPDSIIPVQTAEVSPSRKKISRRRFLQISALAAVGAVGAALEACVPTPPGTVEATPPPQDKKPFAIRDVIDTYKDPSQEPHGDLLDAYEFTAITNLENPKPNSVVIFTNDNGRYVEFLDVNEQSMPIPSVYERTNQFVFDGTGVALQLLTTNTKDGASTVFLSISVGVSEGDRKNAAYYVKRTNAGDKDAEELLITLLNKQQGDGYITLDNLATNQISNIPFGNTETTTKPTENPTEEGSGRGSVIAAIWRATTATPKPTIQPTAVASATAARTPTTKPSPMPEATATAVPSVEQLPATKAAATQLAKSIPTEGTVEQILAGLVMKEIPGVDGKTTYEVASTQSGHPLMMRTEGGEWKRVDLGKLASAKGKVTRLAYNLLMYGSGIKDYDTAAILFNGIASPDGHWYIPYSSENSLRPDRNTFKFDIFDKKFKDLVNAGNNNIMFFHLIWGYQQALPSWLLEGDYTSDQFKTIATDHIKGVMDHFKGKVGKYVVVNEAWGNPWEDTSKFWKKKLGDPNSWVKDMFQAAYDTDPSAKLVFNDFGVEIPGTRLWDGEKENEFYSLLTEIKKSGLPIEAGFQLHLYTSDFGPQNFDKQIEKYRLQLRKYIDAGIPVNITEFDLNDDQLSGLSLADIDALHAKITEALLKTSLEAGVEDFTFFGLSPKYAPQAIMFKDPGQPAPAYYMSEKAMFNFEEPAK